MWDTLWTNVTLCSMQGESGYGLIENATLAVEEGKIAYAGPMMKLSAPPEKLAKNVHDGAGKLVTPGLIDCHTHLVYGGSRAQEWEMRQQGKSYAEIAAAGGGILSTVRETRAASEKSLYKNAARRLQCLMDEGVTTVEIKSGYGLDLDTEMKMLRVARKLGEDYPLTIRTTFLGAHALPLEYTDDRAGYIDLLCNVMLPAIAAEDLADAVDGFCEHIGFTTDEMARVFDTAQNLGLPVKLHAEQLSDQGGCGLAARYQALSADHLEYAQEADISTMAKSGTVAVLLPGAFYFLKETQLPPVALLRRHKVPFALATDCNPGTSPCTSLLLMMNMGCTLFGLTQEEALRAVTVNAAQALGLFDRGRLQTGMRADCLLWDVSHPAELAYAIGMHKPVQRIAVADKAA